MSPTEWMSLVVAVIAIVGQIILFLLNKQARKEIEGLKKKAAEDLKLLGTRLKRLEEVERLRRRYSTPLLKSAEELYNKLNDIIKPDSRAFEFFGSLPKAVTGEIGSIGDVLSSSRKVYLTHVLYLFARYFASVEVIKKDVGLLQLASDEETKAFQRRLRQTVAVFFSGRLHRGFAIRNSDRLKYQGTILEGAQVLIGESMLKPVGDALECISFYEFCQKIAADDFQQSLFPLLGFLGGLEEVSVVDYSKESDIDFRWAKLLLFSSFLRQLVGEVDTAGVVVLLPELGESEQEFRSEHEELKENIDHFKEAYPDP